MEAVEQFLAPLTGRRAPAPWLEPVRAEAVGRLRSGGFPTPRDEDWKYTSVAPITGARFQPPCASTNGVGAPADRVSAFDLDIGGHRLVFVDGRFAPSLSRVSRLPAGVVVGSLARAIAEDPERVRPHLAGESTQRLRHAFTDLNAAFVEDGLLVDVPAGVRLEEPVHVIYLSAGSGVMTSPRNLIVTGRASSVKVVESYGSIGEAPHFTNALSQIDAGEGSEVYHYRLLRERADACHVSNLRLLLAAGCRAWSDVITLGGGLVRNQIFADLAGEHIRCHFHGLYLASGKQHVDNHLRVEHNAPHCYSRQVYKGILDDAGRGVFTGRIYVKKDSQKTDAIQSNQALLLSDRARVNSRPQLEIFADDVRCTHGATSGELDENALFYMLSRGLDRSHGRALLIYAFASEVLDHIEIEALREALAQILSRRLGIESVRKAG